MNVIAITSGKGGTGKSCVAAYAAAALAEAGKKTLLLEQGRDFRSLDIITGVQDKAAFDLSDVLEGRCEVEKAVVAATLSPLLFLLPAPVGAYLPPDKDAFTGLLLRLRQEYDYILVDGVDFSVVPEKVWDSVVMVTTPDTLGIRACQEATRQLYENGVEQVRLVINKVPAQVLPIHGVEDFDDVIDQIGAQLIAVIPKSPKLHYSANNAKELDADSITVKVFANLAARLRGQSRPLLIC